MAAVSNGVIALGIKANDGVVLGTVRKQESILTLPHTIEKISQLTPDACICYAGLGPDFRVLVDKARKAAHANYKHVYGVYPPTKVLVQEIARVMQEATQSGGVRPFGVSVLVAGWDDVSGPTLYQVDPFGAFYPWKATAIGKGAASAKTFLEKRYGESGMELDDAVHTALITLKESFEGEMTPETVEIAIIGQPDDSRLGYEGVAGVRGPRYAKLSEEQIKDYLDQI